MATHTEVLQSLNQTSNETQTVENNMERVNLHCNNLGSVWVVLSTIFCLFCVVEVSVYD